MSDDWDAYVDPEVPYDDNPEDGDVFDPLTDDEDNATSDNHDDD